MTEQKRRGRPTNAEMAARKVTPPAIEGGDVTHNGDTEYYPQPKEEPMPQTPSLLPPTAADEQRERAQTYAMRVWSGQSQDVGRAVRIARCKAAVEGQNLPTDGLTFPGADPDDDWTDEDRRPVIWRKASQ